MLLYVIVWKGNFNIVIIPCQVVFESIPYSAVVLDKYVEFFCHR